MITIDDIYENKAKFDQAVQFFWRKWGTEDNYHFYKNCMEHASLRNGNLPRFYTAEQAGEIIGSYALLRSDLNSRQDLYPWFACLYVLPELRGLNMGAMLQSHALQQADQLGFSKIYLCTELEGYYEKTGWDHIGDAYTFFGQKTKVYSRKTVE